MEERRGARTEEIYAGRGMMTGKVYIDSMRLHAFHGVMEQERVVGNDYLVSVEIEYPLQEACEKDELSGTVNYAVVADMVAEEMKVPSRLVEHVAARIAKRLKQLYPAIIMTRINVKKIAPPMPYEMDGAGVEVWERY